MALPSGAAPINIARATLFERRVLYLRELQRMRAEGVRSSAHLAYLDGGIAVARAILIRLGDRLGQEPRSVEEYLLMLAAPSESLPM